MIDSAAFAWERGEPKAQTTFTSWSFAPNVSSRGGGFTVGRAF